MVANRSTFCGHLAVYIINIGYLLKRPYSVPWLPCAVMNDELITE